VVSVPCSILGNPTLSGREIMTKENKLETKQSALNKRIRSLCVIGRSELKAYLREQYSTEIDKAVKHRLGKMPKTPPMDDHHRLMLRRRWTGIHCPLCGIKTRFECENGDIVEVEHIIERALGGENSDSNLTPCCQKCNRALGQVFNEEVLQSREKRWRGMPKTMWVRLIGDWVVFKELLYCDSDLAFYLFDNFHRQFVEQRNKQAVLDIEYAETLDPVMFGLLARTKMSERLEAAFQGLEGRIEARREAAALEQFQTEHGPPPRLLDMGATARLYRLKLKTHMMGVMS
jgi:hypothetical protein